MSNHGFAPRSNDSYALSLSASPKPTSQQDINKWRAAMQDPTHSTRYAERWDRMEAAGKDIDGEGRAIDALADRGSTILDAGSGNGRLAGYLARAGHMAMGVDLDPYLVDVATTKYPEAHFVVADLADFSLYDDEGQLRTFDIVVAAGNVQTFLAEWERLPALENIAKHMHAGSRYVSGFQLARGYSHQQFTKDAEAAGLEIVQRFGTWQFDAFVEDGEFLLAMLHLKSSN